MTLDESYGVIVLLHDRITNRSLRSLRIV